MTQELKECIEVMNNSMKMMSKAVDSSNQVAHDSLEAMRDIAKTFAVLITTMIIAAFLGFAFLIFMQYGYEFTTSNVNQNINENQIEITEGE